MSIIITLAIGFAVCFISAFFSAQYREQNERYASYDRSEREELAIERLIRVSGIEN